MPWRPVGSAVTPGFSPAGAALKGGATSTHTTDALHKKRLLGTERAQPSRLTEWIAARLLVWIQTGRRPGKADSLPSGSHPITPHGLFQGQVRLHMMGDIWQKGKVGKGRNPKSMTYQRARNAAEMACGGPPEHQGKGGRKGFPQPLAIPPSAGIPTFPQLPRGAAPILGPSRLNLNEHNDYNVLHWGRVREYTLFGGRTQWAKAHFFVHAGSNR